MSKLTDIRNLALANAGYVSASPKDWMRFLDTASRMYRYPFPDQLLIYAQQPEATACATLEVWNTRLNRWVNRGAKGIALIDDTVQPPRLKYVFDVSSTHAVRPQDEPYIWKLENRHREVIRGHLVSAFTLEGEPSLEDALRQIARQFTSEYIDELLVAAQAEMGTSGYASLADEARRDVFSRVLEESIFYCTARRSGLDAEKLVTESDFSGINHFNRMAVLSVLGSAVSRFSESVLVEIGREVRKFDRENPVFPLAKENRLGYNEFSALKRESHVNINDDQTILQNEPHNSRHEENDTPAEEGGNVNETDVHAQRRLSVSEPDDRVGSEGAHREIRPAAQELPQRAQDGLVPEHADDREAGQALKRDRQGRADETGEDDRADAQNEPRAEQGVGSAGLGSPHEQPDGGSGRDHPERAYLLLNEETDTEAETETENETETGVEIDEVSALSLPETPTVTQQINEIAGRILPPASFTAGVPANVVDHFLRTGNNRRGSIARLIHYASLEMPIDEKSELIRKEYNSGSKGLIIDGRRYVMRYDENGLYFSEGNAVNALVPQISWRQATERISELLEAGVFAQQGVLETVQDQALRVYAQMLWYMKRDLENEIEQTVFRTILF